MRISDWSSDVCSSDLALSGANGCLAVTLEYDAGATVEGGADRMSEQFAALLGAVLEAPDSELDDHDIVGPRERRLLPESFRGPVVSVLEPRLPVHQLGRASCRVRVWPFV